MNRLKNKHIIVGVTGGIAAYKSADLVRRLREVGVMVRVVMTQHAKEFITPLTMQAVSGFPVLDTLFDEKAEAAMSHIELARWADLVLIAPATADCMAQIVQGEARDLLTTLCLVTRAPIALAPAMNQAMWRHPATYTNVTLLKEKGYHLWGPEEGSQACGEVGPGRMMEVVRLVENTIALFHTGKLAGKKIMITAGPTREAIDPIRYLSNRSSGKMGYALAEAARDAGAEVLLISGPVSLEKPDRVMVMNVLTADEMYQTVMKSVAECDIFLGVAAVADYRVKHPSAQKITKKNTEWTLALEPTPDILASVALSAKRPLVIGFAAETEDLLSRARVKLVNKKLDMIIANTVGKEEGLEQDENAVTVVWGDRECHFDLMPKRKLARELIQLITTVFYEKEPVHEM